MADVKSNLEKISSAVYGRDVRTAIHDSIAAVNEEVAGNTKACEAGEKARAQAEAKRAAAEKARADAEAKRAAAEEARAAAEKERASTQGSPSGTPAEAPAAESVHVCAEGEYENGDDTAPRKPEVEGPKQGVLYLTPLPEPTELGSYAAWLYVDDGWQLLGSGAPAAAEGDGDPTPAISLPLSLGEGGTGATDAAGARSSLSVYSKEEVDGLVAKAGSASDGGASESQTVEVTGTSFANTVEARVVSVEAGTFDSKVDLKLHDGSDAVAVVDSDAVAELGVKKGAVVIAAFDARSVSIVSSMSIANGFKKNLWRGTVTDAQPGTLETRVDLTAMGTTVRALVLKDIAESLGLNETTGALLYVSPYDMHLLAK